MGGEPLKGAKAFPPLTYIEPIKTLPLGLPYLTMSIPSKVHFLGIINQRLQSWCYSFFFDLIAWIFRICAPHSYSPLEGAKYTNTHIRNYTFIDQENAPYYRVSGFKQTRI